MRWITLLPSIYDIVKDDAFSSLDNGLSSNCISRANTQATAGTVKLRSPPKCRCLKESLAMDVGVLDTTPPPLSPLSCATDTVVCEKLRKIT